MIGELGGLLSSSSFQAIMADRNSARRSGRKPAAVTDQPRFQLEDT